MAVGNLPSPPDFESVEAWAGVGRVIRAGASDVAGWRLPPQQKAALTSCGVPLLEGVVDMTLFAAELRNGKYRLAGTRSELYHAGYIYLAEPETGLVSVLQPSSGHLRFVNSSINHWLCSLHLVGMWFSSSTAIQTWDEYLAKELASRKPSLHRMVATGVALVGDPGSWTKRCGKALAGGPPPLTEADRRWVRYGLTDLLDDLEHANNDGETTVIGVFAWRMADGG
ncbi:SUKH-4 family immunity protein [Micromonospora sp. NBC_00898]|uniref:SUKH-4 family immunity protein n=1 Tax=Micromonospora sp. NBC_00898 TaxID=2975981 RepID=UPI00386D290F|nr:SUKH-4 family immunity protein [Micromonospora sp. NBC_00898]